MHAIWFQSCVGGPPSQSECDLATAASVPTLGQRTYQAGGAVVGGQTDPMTITLQLSLLCNIQTGAI